MKFTDLVDQADALTGMLLSQTNAAHTGAGTYYDANTAFYHRAGYPNFAKMAYDRVVETKFRDKNEGLVVASEAHSSYYRAKFRDHGLFDSIVPEAFDDGPLAPTGDTTMDAWQQAQDLYDYLVATNLTDMSYEDWCKAYGVNIPKAQLHEPEVLATWKEWSYPSNTIDPATGAPSSAVSFVVRKNVAARKFFTEPGFLIGIHVLRPKLYFKDQVQSGTDYLNTAMSWLPAVLLDNPATSIRKFEDQELLASVPGGEFMVDMRDVFVHGDQFSNLGSGVPTNFVNMAAASLYQYPANGDLYDLFVTDEMTMCDGFLNLDIVGRQRDMTTLRHSVA